MTTASRSRRRSLATLLGAITAVAGVVAGAPPVAPPDRAAPGGVTQAIGGEDCPRSECGGSGNHNQVLL